MATPVSDPNESTFSLQSSTTVSSNAPLGVPQRPQKDFNAAFATLQSRYGTAGHIPSPKKEPSDKLSKSVPSIEETACSSSQTTLTSSTLSTSDAGSGSSLPGGQPLQKKSKNKFLISMFKGKDKGV